jgi:para-nitrobenzyl esterase
MLSAMTTRFETKSGVISGRQDGDVIAFLGVPYAKPPIDALRFRAPEACVPWAGVREATEVSAAAPQ